MKLCGKGLYKQLISWGTVLCWLMILLQIGLGSAQATALIQTATPTALPTEQPSLKIAPSKIGTSLNGVRNQLIQQIKNEHNLHLGKLPETYRLRNSESYCFLPEAYFDSYYTGITKVIATLVNHPSAKLFSLDELEEMLWEVVPFPVDLIAGGQDAVLAAVKANRGCSIGSHYPPQDLFYVIDRAGTVWDLQEAGFLRNTWFIDGRWLLALDKRANPGSDTPGPYVLLQIGKVGKKWSVVVNHPFEPYPDSTVNLSFTNGYATMIANLTYGFGTDPCAFSQEFHQKYEHQEWMTRQTFKLVDGKYQRVDLQILDFVVYERNSQNVVDVDWLDYCLE